MKHLLTLAASFLLALAAAPADAADIWHVSTIKYIYPQANGTIVLAFATDSASCTSTATPDYYTIAVGQNGVTAEALKHMLAVALSAFALEKQVSINFSDTTTACYINRLLVE
jgi:hypothetical protein